MCCHESIYPTILTSLEISYTPIGWNLQVSIQTCTGFHLEMYGFKCTYDRPICSVYRWDFYVFCILVVIDSVYIYDRPICSV